MGIPHKNWNFEGFHAAHSEKLHRHITKLVLLYFGEGSQENSIACAEDLCQEAWHKVYRRWNKLPDRSNSDKLYSYVYKTARKDLERVLKKRGEFREDAEDMSSADPLRNGGFRKWLFRPSPARSRRDRDIAAAIAALPPAQREVVEATLVEDSWSWVEIADMVGRHPNTVKTLWKRATNKLKVQLLPYLEEAERTMERREEGKAR